MSIDSSAAVDSFFDKYQVQSKDQPKSNELGKDAFLNLLVAQLNNQNPLEPQGNGEFIAQLAQFSQVEGVQQLNQSMDTLLSSFQSSQALQASSLVGRTVILPTEVAQVDTDAGLEASLVLPTASNNVYVNVYDDKGALVNRINLGQQASGRVNFEWDGTNSSGEQMPSGIYKFEAQATYADGAKGLYTLLPANVDSVTLGQGSSEMQLNLAGIGSVPISQVLVIGK